MSTRKKKTVKETVAKPTYKGSSFSIDPSLMGRYRRMGRNPLDDELASEDAMLARDLKTMRVEELNMKRRARMAKLQKEIDKLEKETEKKDSGDSDIPRMSVGMAQQIANLPPGERDKVLQTYAMFRSMDQSKGRGDSLLPLLIGFSKSNPGSSQSDIATYAKAMSDQLKIGMDLMKAVQTKEKPSNVMDFMKVMKDLIVEGVRNPLLQAIEKTQPQASAFEQILLNPEMRSAAKEMGMFGGNEPRTGSTDIDLKIEELRSSNRLEVKKLDLEWRKSLLERESNDRRTDAVLTALAPLSAILSGPVDQRMRQFGQQQAAAHTPPMNPPPPLDNQIMIKCSCGHMGPITFEGPSPEKINCPSCGLELNVGDAPDVSGDLKERYTGA